MALPVRWPGQLQEEGRGPTGRKEGHRVGRGEEGRGGRRRGKVENGRGGGLFGPPPGHLGCSTTTSLRALVSAQTGPVAPPGWVQSRCCPHVSAVCLAPLWLAPNAVQEVRLALRNKLDVLLLGHAGSSLSSMTDTTSERRTPPAPHSSSDCCSLGSPAEGSAASLSLPSPPGPSDLGSAAASSLTLGVLPAAAAAAAAAGVTAAATGVTAASTPRWSGGADASGMERTESVGGSVLLALLMRGEQPDWGSHHSCGLQRQSYATMQGGSSASGADLSPQQLPSSRHALPAGGSSSQVTGYPGGSGGGSGSGGIDPPQQPQQPPQPQDATGCSPDTSDHGSPILQKQQGGTQQQQQGGTQQQQQHAFTEDSLLSADTVLRKIQAGHMGAGHMGAGHMGAGHMGGRSHGGRSHGGRSHGGIGRALQIKGRLGSIKGFHR